MQNMVYIKRCILRIQYHVSLFIEPDFQFSPTQKRVFGGQMLLRHGSVRMHNHPKEPPKGLGWRWLTRGHAGLGMSRRLMGPVALGLVVMRHKPFSSSFTPAVEPAAQRG